LNSLEEKITAHFGTIYLISFTKSSLRSSAMRVKFSQTYKKNNFLFGVDYFLPLPLPPICDALNKLYKPYKPN